LRKKQKAGRNDKKSAHKAYRKNRKHFFRNDADDARHESCDDNCGNRFSGSFIGFRQTAFARNAGSDGTPHNHFSERTKEFQNIVPEIKHDCGKRCEVKEYIE